MARAGIPLTLYLPRELITAMREQAGREDRSISIWVRRLLMAHFESEQSRAAVDE